MGWGTPHDPSTPDWAAGFTQIASDRRVAHLIVKALPARNEIVLMVVLRRRPVNLPKVFRGPRDTVIGDAVRWLEQVA